MTQNSSSARVSNDRNNCPTAETGTPSTTASREHQTADDSGHETPEAQSDATLHEGSGEEHDAPQASEDNELNSDNDDDWTSIFTVLAGEEEKEFTLHRKIFCDHSVFFRYAMTWNWAKTEDAVLNLEHITSFGMKLYVSYVYGQGLDRKTIDAMVAKVMNADPEVAAEDQASHGGLLHAMWKVAILCKLWWDGHFFGDVGYQNAIMDELVEVTYGKSLRVNDVTVETVWSETAEGSVLRKWVLDEVAQSPNTFRWIEMYGDGVPGAFLKELLAMKKSLEYTEELENTGELENSEETMEERKRKYYVLVADESRYQT